MKSKIQPLSGTFQKALQHRQVHWVHPFNFAAFCPSSYILPATGAAICGPESLGSVMVNVDCQLERTWHGWRNKPLGSTIPKYRSELGTSIHHSLLPDCRSSVSSCLEPWLPWLPCRDRLHLQSVSQSKPFLPSGAFVTVMREVTNTTARQEKPETLKEPSTVSTLDCHLRASCHMEKKISFYLINTVVLIFVTFRWTQPQCIRV